MTRLNLLDGPQSCSADTRHRDRLLEADIAEKCLAELVEHPELRGPLSDEHFSVDGTQIAAWAPIKSFKAKDGSGDPPGPGRNREGDFHGEKPSNATRIPRRSSIARGAAKTPGSASWATH